MFVKDRQHEKNTRRQQIIYRMQADAVVGDENLYKIEYVRLHGMICRFSSLLLTRTKSTNGLTPR
jgi:hypothetical protein